MAFKVNNDRIIEEISILPAVKEKGRQNTLTLAKLPNFLTDENFIKDPYKRGADFTLKDYSSKYLEEEVNLLRY